MKKWAFVSGMVLFLTLSIGLSFIAGNQKVTSYRYEGRIAFNSEQDYGKFKQFLADNKDIEIDEGNLIILSSEPPIVVDYSLIVDSNIVFPFEYASRYKSNFENSGILILVITVSTILFFALGMGSMG